MIPQNILDGRALVEKYRTAHDSLYTDKTDVSFLAKTSIEKKAIEIEISDGHETLTEELAKGLEQLGFKSIGEFMHASSEADFADGVEERWA